MGMSIQVNDFQWEPGKNDAEYIKLLESSMDEWQKIAQKAIAKLKALSKAQEPRVLTLEELERLQEEDVIYVEERPVRDLTCISVELVRFVEKIQDPATWIELHTTDSAGFYMTRKTIEPNWRCWTSRPDQATREATPWN